MSTQWYSLRRGGMALIASAALLLILILWSLSLTGDPPVLYVLLNVVAYALLLAGLPAIYAMTPGAGRLGQIGFVCIAVSGVISIIALVLALFGVNSLPTAVDWIYLLTSTFGYILVGWVTARARIFPFAGSGASQPRVFPSWVGWTMLGAGLVSLLLGPGYSTLVLLFAVAGYGITIVRATQPSIATHADGPSIEPLA